MYEQISDYGVVGNLHTVLSIGRNTYFVKQGHPKFLKFMIVNKTHHTNRSFQICLYTLKISAGQKTRDMSVFGHHPKPILR